MDMVAAFFMAAGYKAAPGLRQAETVPMALLPSESREPRLQKSQRQPA
jgi:hypothetical protein